MPVVVKISSLDLVENVYWIAVCHRHIDTPIEIIYDSVVVFLNWYNSQKK
jgi:hypothetical protein